MTDFRDRNGWGRAPWRDVSLRACGRVGALLLGLLLAPWVARANWQPFPGNITLDTGFVPTLHTCTDGSGGIYIAGWRRLDPDFDHWDLDLWHENGDGTLAFHVTVDTLIASSRVGHFTVAYDGSGGCVLSAALGATASAPSQVVAQHFLSDGQRTWGIGGGPRVHDGAVTRLVSTGDGSGGAVIAWDDSASGVASAQRLVGGELGGEPAWTTRLSEDLGLANDYAGSLSIASDGAAGAFVALCNHSGNHNVFVQHVTGSGGLACGPDPAEVSSAGLVPDPVPCMLVSDLAGGGWLAYRDRDDLTSATVQITRVPSSLGVGTAFTSYSVPTDPLEHVLGIPEVVAFSNRIYISIGVLWIDAPTFSYQLIIQEMDSGGTFLLDPGTYNAQTLLDDGEPSTVQPIMTDEGTGSVMVHHVVPGMQKLCCEGKSGTFMAFGYQHSQPEHPYPAGVLYSPCEGLDSSPSASAFIDRCGTVPGGSYSTVVAWADDGGVHVQQVTLNDIDVTQAPAGWDFPVVPRNSEAPSLSDVKVTPLKSGWPVWLYGNYQNHGPGVENTCEYGVFVDGSFVFGNVTDLGFYVGPNKTVLEPEPPDYLVPGGRHTVSAEVNLHYPVSPADDRNPFNNVWSHQFIWDPPRIPPNIVAGPIPPKDPWEIPDGIGYRFDTEAPVAGLHNAYIAAAAAKRGPTMGTSPSSLKTPHRSAGRNSVLGYGDSYGLMLFDWPAGVEEFSHLIGESHQSSNQTNFLLEFNPSAPESLYPLVVRDSVGPGNPDSCFFSYGFADGREGPASGSSWTNQTMAPGELADVFVLNTAARQTLKLSLRVHGGAGGYPPSPCKFEVFTPTPGAVFARGGGVASHTESAQIESLTFVAASNGPYLVAVFREDGSQAESTVTYDFVSSTTAALGAPDAPTQALSFAGAEPNPAVDGTTLAFTLPVQAAARLDIYDVSGRRVCGLISGIQEAGDHRVRWDGRGESGAALDAGLYWARLEFGGRTITRRMTILR
jgi:FlgD Ig-like domain